MNCNNSHKFLYSHSNIFEKNKDGDILFAHDIFKCQECGKEMIKLFLRDMKRNGSFIV